MQPGAAAIGLPFRLERPGPPQRHAVEADEQIVGSPNRREGLFHIRHAADEPLRGAMADAVAGKNPAMHRRRPAVVVPCRHVVAIDAGAKLLEIIPGEIDGVFRLLAVQRVGDDDIAVLIEIGDALLRTRRKARHMRVDRRERSGIGGLQICAVLPDLRLGFADGHGVFPGTARKGYAHPASGQSCSAAGRVITSCRTSSRCASRSRYAPAHR